jgi:hypothetical protein
VKLRLLMKRLWLFALCLTASVVPTLSLAGLFGLGDFLLGLGLVWVGVLLGPLAEVVLYGGPPGPCWLVPALACPPLMVAHPIRPGWASGALTIAGFALWYAAAFLAIGIHEAPV